jgi:hypothetical protein
MFRHCFQLLLFAFLVTCTLRAAEDPFCRGLEAQPIQKQPHRPDEGGKRRRQQVPR